MRRKIRLWTAAAFLIALAVTVLPVVKRITFRQETDRQLAALESRVNSLGQEQLKKQRNLAKWYNYGLEREDPGVKWAYNKILDFGGGAMAILEVQELKLRLPVFHGTEEIVGHDPQTPFPIGGRGNHTVLTLRAEYGWEEGMLVYIDCLGERLAYQVESVQEMRKGWSVARPTQAGQDILTLIFDRGDTRTMIRCVRCVDLTVRPIEQTEYRQVLVAALSPILICVPALCVKIWDTVHGLLPRLFGFFHKNISKTNLS